jgi:hypothetical protein
VNGINPSGMTGAVEWEFDFDAFIRITHEMGLTTDVKRAEAMGIHYSSISKIRSEENRPGRKFIEGTATIGIPFAEIFRKKVGS